VSYVLELAAHAPVDDHGTGREAAEERLHRLLVDAEDDRSGNTLDRAAADGDPAPHEQRIGERLLSPDIAEGDPLFAIASHLDQFALHGE
jgi:hypothetical protein